MWIAAGTRLLALAIFLNSVEFISSQQRTLEDLFPVYNGVMPPVKELHFEDQFSNFITFRGENMSFIPRHFVKRDHIIFGYLWASTIQYLSILFANCEDLFIVFNTNEQRWVTLSHDLARKLGADRVLPLVVARDEVAATHVTTSHNPLYREAHIRGCRYANNRVDIVEGEQVHLLVGHKTTVENSIRVIKEEYSEAYNSAFMLHLHPPGEYEVHGYRVRHP